MSDVMKGTIAAFMCAAVTLVGLEVHCYAGMLVAGDHNNKTLLEIDPQSGHGTVIGSLGFEVTGLAYDSTHHVLYGCSKSTLYEINPLTADSHAIGSFGAGIDAHD